MERSSGILLHLSSLPGGHGIGDLGPPAREFLEYLVDTQQTWWQMLPVGPTGAGHSPYQSPSSLAGSSLFLSLDRLRDDGLLDARDLKDRPRFPIGRVDFRAVHKFKHDRLRRAFSQFGDGTPEFDAFTKAQSHWLADYALFSALRDRHGDGAWTDWPTPLKRRAPRAIANARDELAREVRYHCFLQYVFTTQWNALRREARARHIKLIGDVPIFVSHDSAEVWARPELFQLDKTGAPTAVAGVPPDYFCEDGQRWGNPLYRWQAHAAENFAWWIARLCSQLARFDLVRLDHFRGFEAYWRIPASAPTARTGRWVAGPRDQFFDAIKSAFGALPLIAEDLGDITPPVLALRDRYGLPGMKVLQFAFGSGPSNPYLPMHYPTNCVVYTGTHDNDTTVGWIQSLERRSEHRSERDFLRRFLGKSEAIDAWDLIRLAFGSVADLAIVPLQDVLGLGAKARMNVPGRADGNWGWRVDAIALEAKARRTRLAEITTVTDRARRKSA